MEDYYAEDAYQIEKGDGTRREGRANMIAFEKEYLTRVETLQGVDIGAISMASEDGRRQRRDDGRVHDQSRHEGRLKVLARASSSVRVERRKNRCTSGLLQPKSKALMTAETLETSLGQLLVKIRECRHCEAKLPCGPRPVLAAHQNSRILIIGQAPGIRVHQSGVAWDDPSGERLREWMGVERTDFYDESKISLVPMGFCYPGTGKSGDLPPRPECADLWHERLLAKLPHVKLTLLVGNYAQRSQLGKPQKATLTDTVKAWKVYRPKFLPLPHPSPRNNIWLRKNPWFSDEVLPYLKTRVKRLLA